MTRPLSKAEQLDLQKILSAYAPQHREEGDITISEAASQWGVGWMSAKRRLERAVRDGLLVRLTDVMLDGRGHGTVYRPVAPPKKKGRKR